MNPLFYTYFNVNKYEQAKSVNSVFQVRFIRRKVHQTQIQFIDFIIKLEFNY